MNASTPERKSWHPFSGDPWGPCTFCKQPAHHELHRAPVRVEEPAGEPKSAWHESLTEEDMAVIREDHDGVAQSANADVRECGWNFVGWNGEKRSCVLLAGHAGHHLYPALPVPVGDETEALRAEAQVVYNALGDLTINQLLARVAGLEAREAALRDALEAIEHHARFDRGHPTFDAIRRLARAALADSGEAGS